MLKLTEEDHVIKLLGVLLSVEPAMTNMIADDT